jgi:two-component system sensor histidine kinase ResE
MIWRSVVGKLWITIILLVAVVLFVLSALLLQFFKDYYVDQAKYQLTELAGQVSDIIETDEDQEITLSATSAIIEAYSASAVVIANDGSVWASQSRGELPHLPASTFLNDPELTKVFEDKKTVLKQEDLSTFTKESGLDKEILIVGTPVELDQGQSGAVFLYESLEVIKRTTDQTKRIIYISAGVAIILTTIFAFFLSTRITAPLRKMREAALQVARGKFDTKVPMVSHDEIGELAVAFNRMGRQLKSNITALNQEKEQLAGVLSSMADGVITFDRLGRTLVTNPPAERFIRAWYYKKGMNTQEELPAQVKDVFQRVVTLEKEQMTEVNVQGRSWVIVMTPLYNQSHVRGAVAVLRDMTEERRLDKLRKDFIANVSHELRTPVSMLRGYSEAIIDDIAATDEEKREIAQIIYEESLRMGRLVNELLDLARMESGYIRLNKEAVAAGDFLERVIRKFYGVAKEKGVQLELKKSTYKNETLRFDPDRIEQVLTNLIDNAIRHSREDGSVTITLETYESGMKIDVKDDGTGIPEQDVPFVFERFYKADKARTRGQSGTGLGLSIARNIVEAHNGTITVHSKVGEGTEFSFFIPGNLDK